MPWSRGLQRDDILRGLDGDAAVLLVLPGVGGPGLPGLGGGDDAGLVERELGRCRDVGEIERYEMGRCINGEMQGDDGQKQRCSPLPPGSP